MFIFGSSDLAVSFIPHGLIDEYRIMVNPVFLGAGKPLLKGIKDRIRTQINKYKDIQVRQCIDLLRASQKIGALFLSWHYYRKFNDKDQIIQWHCKES